jgi:hypothetical protein
VITGGGKWVEIKTHADPLYQHLVITAERKFWRCVENGEPPTLFGVEPPKPRMAAARVMPGPNLQEFFPAPAPLISNTNRLRPSSRNWCRKTRTRRLGMASKPDVQIRRDQF